MPYVSSRAGLPRERQGGSPGLFLLFLVLLRTPPPTRNGHCAQNRAEQDNTTGLGDGSNGGYGDWRITKCYVRNLEIEIGRAQDHLIKKLLPV